jgi:hypothetical protein
VDAAEAIRQIDEALALAEEALDASEQPFRFSGQYPEAVTFAASTIDRLTATNSVYQVQTKRLLDRRDADVSYVEGVLGILKGLRRDIEAGYLQTLEEELHADVFADFLDMADHLSKAKLPIPAAVVAGSALEAHLRALAEKAGVNTQARGQPKRAGRLNDDLAKKGTYRKAEQKQIVAWQDIRNSAAHGDGEFSPEEVRLMTQGIRDFIVRHPA